METLQHVETEIADKGRAFGLSPRAEHWLMVGAAIVTLILAILYLRGQMTGSAAAAAAPAATGTGSDWTSTGGDWSGVGGGINPVTSPSVTPPTVPTSTDTTPTPTPVQTSTGTISLDLSTTSSNQYSSASSSSHTSGGSSGFGLSFGGLGNLFGLSDSSSHTSTDSFSSQAQGAQLVSDNIQAQGSGLSESFLSAFTDKLFAQQRTDKIINSRQVNDVPPPVRAGMQA